MSNSVEYYDWGFDAVGSLTWAVLATINGRRYSQSRRIPSHIEPTAERKAAEEVMGLKMILADIAHYSELTDDD